MILFYEATTAAGEPYIGQFNFHLTDNVEEQIKALLPADTSLMAEHSCENSYVLETAVNNWSGYGLYYPNINELDLKKLQVQCPKIILLKPDEPSAEIFSKFGCVVFNADEYQQEVSKLVYFATFFCE